MIEIKPILPLQFKYLISIGIQTFLESHGHSAQENDIDIYLRYAFSEKKIKSELEDQNNYFHFLYENEQIIGYSKLIPNLKYNEKMPENAAKLERIYLLNDKIGQNLGQKLFEFNLDLTKSLNQSKIWLYSWVENERGLKFYKKNGFEVIDKADFKISATHVNPNYILCREL